MAIQSMFPVYLPKRQQDVRNEDYDTGIAQNENALNQNLKILYDQLVAQEDTIAEQASVIQDLRETINRLQGVQNG